MDVCLVMFEEKLIKIMRTKEHLMRDLSIVQTLQLPNGYIAAGYVRNYVWDYLHHRTSATSLNDVDVIYYDTSDLSEETEKRLENRLKNHLNEYNWSVKNQARMHTRNHSKPYLNIADAMKRWPETATAVGIRLDQNHNIKVVAPHGLIDLFNFIVRRSPYFEDRELFLQRIQSKNWLELWPKLNVVEESDLSFLQLGKDEG